MLLSFGIAVFASATSCFSHSLHTLASRSDLKSSLEVHLSQADGSTIKAEIKNRGKTEIRLLQPGSFLGAYSFGEKVRVYKDGTPVTFSGIVPEFSMDNWKAEHFVTLSPGKTLSNTIDLSTTHDLSLGGDYAVEIKSAIPYADGDSTQISGTIPYKTNNLKLKLPKRTAEPTLTSRIFGKRARFAHNCSMQQLNNLTRAAVQGAAWASAGSLEALKFDSPVWHRYFRLNSSTQGATNEVLLKFHSIVSARLANVARELSAGLVSEIHCVPDIRETALNDQQGANVDLCAAYPDQAIAYTIRSSCQIALCPMFWKLENKNDDCMSDGLKGGFEQTGVLIHELTHCNKIGQIGVQPSTDDLAYNYNDTINDEFVTAGTSVQNAQSHALFAKATYVKGSKC